MFLTLLRKEIVLEFRQRYAISGIVLYVFSMIFVVYVASIRVHCRRCGMYPVLADRAFCLDQCRC
jgi:hypothetical protein